MKHVLIIAYNRIDYLNRLIRSLRNQKSYTSDYKLWFVIDYSEIQSEIIECITNSNLEFEFEIIARDVNYGLKKNVIESVTEIFEKIDSQQLIYLEDDLVLSPYTFNYIEAVHRAKLDLDRLFGISLYAQTKNEWNGFYLNFTNYNSFFAAILPASLGSIFFKNKWSLFRNALDATYGYALPEDSNHELPLLSWSNTNSWKKELLKFCVVQDLFTLYPKVSCVAHMGNAGTNVNISSNAFFNSTMLYTPCDFEDIDMEKIDFLDIFFEYNPIFFKDVIDSADIKNVVVDLYGLKKIKNLDSYYLTSKKCKNSKMSFGFEYGFLPSNILEKLDGNYFSLARGRDIVNKQAPFTEFFEANFSPNFKRNITAYILLTLFKKARKVLEIWFCKPNDGVN
jgi:hypothetical protein